MRTDALPMTDACHPSNKQFGLIPFLQMKIPNTTRGTLDQDALLCATHRQSNARAFLMRATHRTDKADVA